MASKNTRIVNFDGSPSFVAIRLARCWAQGPSGRDADWAFDWTPGPSYGSRRATTWAEKRAAVAEQFERAKDEASRLAEYRERRERNEVRHAEELFYLRLAKDRLENKSFRIDIREPQRRIDEKIRALLEAE